MKQRKHIMLVTWYDFLCDSDVTSCYSGRCQGNVTSYHINRLAAPTCCALHVLMSRISLIWPWWISPRSSIIC